MSRSWILARTLIVLRCRRARTAAAEYVIAGQGGAVKGIFTITIGLAALMFAIAMVTVLS